MNVNFETNQWFDKGLQIKYEIKNIYVIIQNPKIIKI